MHTHPWKGIIVNSYRNDSRGAVRARRVLQQSNSLLRYCIYTFKNIFDSHYDPLVLQQFAYC